MSRRVLAGIGAPAAAPGNWTPYFNLILTTSGSGELRTDQRDGQYDNINFVTNVETLDGQVTQTVFVNSGPTASFPAGSDDARLRSHYNIEAIFDTTIDVRFGPMPVGDYLIRCAMGPPAGVTFLNAQCRWEVYDGSGRGGGGTTLEFTHEKPTKITTAGRYWDGAPEDVDFDSAGYFANQVMEPYPTGRYHPITVTDRSGEGAVQTGIRILATIPGASSNEYNRLSYVEILEPV